MKFFIEKRVDINDTNNKYESGLYNACSNYKIAKLLIENGADINSQSYTYGKVPLLLFLTLERSNYSSSSMWKERNQINKIITWKRRKN